MTMAKTLDFLCPTEDLHVSKTCTSILLLGALLWIRRFIFLRKMFVRSYFIFMGIPMEVSGAIF